MVGWMTRKREGPYQRAADENIYIPSTNVNFRVIIWIGIIRRTVNTKGDRIRGSMEVMATIGNINMHIAELFSTRAQGESV